MNTENLIESYVDELTASRGKTAAHITTGVVKSTQGNNLNIVLAGNSKTNTVVVRKVKDLSVSANDICLVIYEGSRFYAIAKL